MNIRRGDIVKARYILHNQVRAGRIGKVVGFSSYGGLGRFGHEVRVKFTRKHGWDLANFCCGLNDIDVIRRTR